MPVMLVDLKIGQVKYGGVISLDTIEKKVTKIEIFDEQNFTDDFPKGKIYTYEEIEKILMLYTKNKFTSIDKIVEEISENGFFYPLKPGLEIDVNIVE